jgi:hypothetical protein
LAQAKRDRKNIKRARDAELQRYADRKFREALEAGVPKGFWLAGVYAQIEEQTQTSWK